MTQLNATSETQATPRWLHWLAVLTVVAALPLLTLGAEVTTKKGGMIDKAPVRSPLHVFEVLAEKGGWDNAVKENVIWLIEHSHRTVGWLVGLLAIGLAVGLALFERRPWVRWAGVLAPASVACQGVLGILRVDLDTRLNPDAGVTVALIHGCTAQLVFALLVSVALWTSAGWQRLGAMAAADLIPARRPALALVGV